MDGYKAMAANLEANAHHTRLSTVFENFVEMFALTLRNATDRQDETEWQAREDAYLAIADRYDRKALDRFAETIALVTIEMASRPADVLGRLYMELELGNGSLGQFFTPYDIARLIAEMNVGELILAIEADGQAAVYEPACGAGAFLIATVEALRNRGIDCRHLHVTAEDIAAHAVHMTFIHLTLLDVPAIVHRRDTLTQQTYESWPTRAHLLTAITASTKDES